METPNPTLLDKNRKSAPTDVYTFDDDDANEETYIAHVENGIVVARVRTSDWDRYCKKVGI